MKRKVNCKKCKKYEECEYGKLLSAQINICNEYEIKTDNMLLQEEIENINDQIEENKCKIDILLELNRKWKIEIFQIEELLKI